MGRTLGIWGIAAALLLTAAVAGADVTLSATAGGDDRLREGCWLPIHVIANNDEVDRKGRVEVTLEDFAGEGNSASLAMDLPPGSSKAAFVYVPPGRTADAYVVRYVDERRGEAGRLEKPLRLSGSRTPVFGIVGNEPRSLRRAAEEMDWDLVPCRLPLETVPDRPEGLQMYDVIVVADPPPVPLDAARSEALASWVARGGMLIISAAGPSDFLRSPGLQDLLPFMPAHTRHRALESLDGEAEAAEGAVTGRVLLESGELPLVIQRGYGLGSSTAFAVAMDDPVWLQWDGAGGLWEALLDDAVALQAPQGGMFQGQDGAQRYAERLAETTAIAEPPALRLGIVVVLMTLYALLAGPGDYFFVRWMKRPMLTWITFPCLVAVFTLAAYFGARAMVGGAMSARSAEAVFTFPQAQRAYSVQLYTLFAPRTSSYAISCERGGFLARFEQEMSSDEQHHDNSRSVLIDHIRIWQEATHSGATSLAYEDQIQFTWGRGGDGRFVAIHNAGDESLGAGRLEYGGRTYVVQELEPGEEVRVPLLEWGEDDSPDLGTIWIPPRNASPAAWVRPLDVGPALARGAAVYAAEIQRGQPRRLEVDGEDIPAHGPATGIWVVEQPEEEAFDLG